MRHASAPMSANGRMTTESENPKPPASASIDVAYARAPSGASSTTATVATVAVMMRNARWNDLRAGHEVQVRRERGDAAHDGRAGDADEDRSPPAPPVGQRDADEREERAEARHGQRVAPRRVRSVERVRDRPAELAHERGSRTTTTATAAAALARCVDCSSVNVAVGSPIDGLRRRRGAARPSSSACSRASA